MNKRDIARPHRLLINRSLHKEADKLRAHIDEYKQRYEDRFQQNIDELEAAQNKLNNDLEQAKESILTDLAAYQDVMEVISNSIVEYVSVYYNRQLLFKRKEVNALQLEIVKEYIQFLSDQMNEIGTEIKLLRDRIDLISREAAVDDVLQLIRLSGTALPIENVHNARELLDLVKNQMDAIYDSDRTTWGVMLNVRRLLEERVSFLSEIQYITWVIEQKRQLSKELKGLRDIELQNQSDLQVSADVIQNDIDSAGERLLNIAKEIRFYWARPIVFIGADIQSKSEVISYLGSEIRELSGRCNSRWNEMKSVQADIKAMKSYHSSDSYRWERLQRESQDLYEEYQSLKSKKDKCCSDQESLELEIDGLKSQRTEWNKTRKRIQEIMWNHSAPLMRIGSKDQYDDEAYAEIRMQELTDIAAESMKAAEVTYKDELGRIQTEKAALIHAKSSAVTNQAEIIAALKQKLSETTAEVNSKRTTALRNAENVVSSIREQLDQQKKKTENAARKLEVIKSADKRFVVARWLSDTPEIEMAKAALKKENEEQRTLERRLLEAKKATSSESIDKTPEVAETIKVLTEIQQEVVREEERLKEIESNFDAQIAECDVQIQTLKPKPERPTTEERTEMQMIRTWSKAQQRLKRKRRRDEPQ